MRQRLSTYYSKINLVNVANLLEGTHVWPCGVHEPGFIRVQQALHSTTEVRWRHLQEKMVELQKQLSKLEGERAELESRRTLLDSACRLRDDELNKVRPIVGLLQSL